VTDAPFDVGLQPERTLLAWRRTALAVAAGSAVVARLSMDTSWPLLALAGIAGIALAATGYVVASVRYRRTHSALHSGAYRHDSRPIALIGLGTLVLSLVAASWVLVNQLSGPS
jgi:uncharacterized membrane protein YidH (DUF202 family)